MSLYNYNILRTALCSITTMLVLYSAQAQTKIGATAGPGNASAVLELQSTSQGFLHPRMTTTQRDAISNPATGLTIYNTTTNCIQVYKGAGNGGWFDLCSTGGGDLSFTNCSTPVITGTFTAQTPATTTIQLNYTNNTGQTFAAFSTNMINGITLTAPGGAVTPVTAGSSSITLTASGTPAAQGNFNIPVILAGAACNIAVTVAAFQGNIPVACGTAPGCTGGVTDPATAVVGDKICWGGFEYFARTASAGGRLWLDRNLGAKQVPSSQTDVAGWGDYYQWGRKGDGHQCTEYSNGGSLNGGTNPASSTTTTLAASSSPGHNQFIIAAASPNDWLTVQNTALWDASATGGVNNPCPLGWRVPTDAELNAASIGSFTSLNLPLAGYRDGGSGVIGNHNSLGMLWTATVSGLNSTFRYRNTSNGVISGNSNRAAALPIRCTKH